MNEFDDPQAILAEDLIDEDGERLTPLDGYGAAVRGLLEDGLTFAPLDKPSKIDRQGWRRNARRDNTLRRAVALLVGGYGMSVNKASAVVARECEPLVKAMGKSPSHPGPITDATTIRNLWAKGGYTDALKVRAGRVADRPIVLRLLADLAESDSAIEKLRRKEALFLRRIISSE